MIINILKLSIIFTVIDFIYLSMMSNKFKIMIKNIQGSELQMNIISTIFCYMFLIFLLYFFIVYKKQKVIDAFLLGLTVYGIYETTNLAIFKKWDPVIGVIDTLWGGVLFATSYYLYLLF